MMLNQHIPFNLNFSKKATSSTSAISVRLASTDDIDKIMAMHQHLSSDTLYNRYHSPRLPTRREIEYMCKLNSKNGRTIVALDEYNGNQIVGVAFYVTNPDLPIAAEVAFLVADSYQGQGIGRKLMDYLVKQALHEQIRFFDGYICASNYPMINLLHRSGKLVENHLSRGTVEMRIELPTLSVNALYC